MNQCNASLIRLHDFIFYDFVDQLILAVPEAIHCFRVRRIVGTSFGELNTARCEKVANAVVAGLAIYIEAVVRGDIEGTKYFASLRRTLLKVFVKHLFPTRRMYAGGIGDHAVEVEQDGVVPVAGNRTRARGLLRRSLSICFAHSLLLPVSNAVAL